MDELVPEDCLNYDENCQGEVQYYSVGDSLRSFPRCKFHIEKRWEQYDNSIERYANSDLAPDWFDPSYAGERWDDD